VRRPETLTPLHTALGSVLAVGKAVSYDEVIDRNKSLAETMALDVPSVEAPWPVVGSGMCGVEKGCRHEVAFAPPCEKREEEWIR
jgi:hypothetical protein